MADDEDLKNLGSFLRDVDERLDFVISESDYIIPELRQYARAAWIAERPRLTEAIDWAEKVLQDAEHEGRGLLDYFGLSGPSLSWKLYGFRKALGELQDAIADKAERAVLPMLRRLLGWINSILGSLSRVLPMLAPIKELKESVENSLRD